MKTKFYKTDHFWERTWERGFQQAQIDKLISDIKPGNGKSIAVFGKQKLNKAGIKLSNKSHLIIVMKGRALVTIFPVPDLFYYLKSVSKKANILVF